MAKVEVHFQAMFKTVIDVDTNDEDAVADALKFIDIPESDDVKYTKDSFCYSHAIGLDDGEEIELE